MDSALSIHYPIFNILKSHPKNHTIFLRSTLMHTFTLYWISFAKKPLKLGSAFLVHYVLVCMCMMNIVFILKCHFYFASAECARHSCVFILITNKRSLYHIDCIWLLLAVCTVYVQFGFYLTVLDFIYDQMEFVIRKPSVCVCAWSKINIIITVELCGFHETNINEENPIISQ